jgi:hypothetical protein
MNTWLFRQFSGSVAALASWQPTHQTAVRTLRRTLKAHEKRGRSIDPSRITGELEHRYSVCKGSKLIAVYWLSATSSPRTAVPDPGRTAATKPRLSGQASPH